MICIACIVPDDGKCRVDVMKSTQAPYLYSIEAFIRTPQAWQSVNQLLDLKLNDDQEAKDRGLDVIHELIKTN